MYHCGSKNDTLVSAEVTPPSFNIIDNKTNH